MNKVEVVRAILGERWQGKPKNESAASFAPSNIALCKYWGKRNQELNLPMTSSLSISLDNKGATAELRLNNNSSDSIILNGNKVELFSSFAKRLIEFLNLFRKNSAPHFDIHIQSNIPVAAGMASSACGFASIVQALNKLFCWELSEHELSILARLGSGSACRSLWQGFVEWHVGMREDGMDSHGIAIPTQWPELCVGLLILSEKEKGLGSREAMQRTITTSPLYSAWPDKVNHDLSLLKQAITVQDFKLLGQTAESNAITMHATMLSAWPPIMYFMPETVAAMHQIWKLRHDGVLIYFTQDAGPNLKLLFLEKDLSTIREQFPNLDVLKPFSK
ncbi:MAG: diphosphomevalonate decarboxylase [Gammaproteobacteria bacterium]